MFRSNTPFSSVVLFALSAFTPSISAALESIDKVGEVLAGGYTNNINVYANNVTQCGYANITWTGAAPPATLEIGQGGYYVGETSVANLTAGWENYTQWLVTQAAGVDLIFQIVDADGNKGYVQNIQVGNGSDWCLESSSSTMTSTWIEASSATSSVSPSETTAMDSSLSAYASASVSVSSDPYSASSSSSSFFEASASSTFDEAPSDSTTVASSVTAAIASSSSVTSAMTSESSSESSGSTASASTSASVHTSSSVEAAAADSSTTTSSSSSGALSRVSIYGAPLALVVAGMLVVV